MTLTPDEYDDLFKQIDFKTRPYGGRKDYVEWAKSKINKKIASYLKKGNVLDAGGGYGHLKYFLADDQIYHNLEYSKEIQKYDLSEYKIIGTALSLPFKDNTFENVVSGDVLEHVPDKRKYLEECFRVLNSNGVFVVNTPTPGTPNQRFYSSFCFYFFLAGAFIMRLFFSLSSKSNGHDFITIPDAAIDEPSDEYWLYSTLNDVGFTIIDGKRTAVHLPLGLDGRLWQKIADSFINESYGNSVLFACKKEIKQGRSRSFESLDVLIKQNNFFGEKLQIVSEKIISTFTKI
jgi:ubiquinone/menaquinone biosynthesis C-methylase UbiE